METRQLEIKSTKELLKLARERINVPNSVIKIDYQKDVDLLFILFSDKPSVRGKMDYENDVIYNYDAENNLVSVEILDLYGIFASI
ncbi:MAG: DUF2283 domain-containing protein [Pyrinomonadaceae bacterium]